MILAGVSHWHGLMQISSPLAWPPTGTALPPCLPSSIPTSVTQYLFLTLIDIKDLREKMPTFLPFSTSTFIPCAPYPSICLVVYRSFILLPPGEVPSFSTRPGSILWEGVCRASGKVLQKDLSGIELSLKWLSQSTYQHFSSPQDCEMLEYSAPSCPSPPLRHTHTMPRTHFGIR